MCAMSRSKRSAVSSSEPATPAKVAKLAIPDAGKEKGRKTGKVLRCVGLVGYYRVKAMGGVRRVALSD